MNAIDCYEGVEISQKLVDEYLPCLVINCRMIVHAVNKKYYCLNSHNLVIFNLKSGIQYL